MALCDNVFRFPQISHWIEASLILAFLTFTTRLISEEGEETINSNHWSRNITETKDPLQNDRGKGYGLLMTIIQGKRFAEGTPTLLNMGLEMICHESVDSELVEWGGQDPHTNTTLATTYDNILMWTVTVDPTEGESKAFNESRELNRRIFKEK